MCPEGEQGALPCLLPRLTVERSRSMTFVGVWRDEPKEHKVKADADREKEEMWLDLRQRFRPRVSKTMRWKQLPDLNTLSGGGPKG